MDETDSLEKFCETLPKLELHAHLNGSLSPATLKTLYYLQNPKSERGDGEWNEWQEFDQAGDSLDECFKAFAKAHELTSEPEYVRIAVHDVIKEFHDDNVIYLELRSTPRSVDEKMSKTEYILAIIDAIIDCESKYPNIMVKLLVSVDRKRGYENARENVRLAIDLSKEYKKYIVGIDLSGDPKTGSAFLELLKNCREAGLKIAAHCAEVPNPEEVKDIINFKPDRLGHGTCVHPSLNGSQELFDMLLESKIPVELCPTSNVKCRTVPNYESHHLKYLHEVGHPIAISTDDKGVFSTSLSKEYEHVAKHLGIGRTELRRIAKSTVRYTFATEEENLKLLKFFETG